MNKLLSSVRKRVNQRLSSLPNYFVEFPFEEIDEILAEHNILLLQEDYTPYSAIFCGEEGHAEIMLGWLNSAVERYYDIDGDEHYTTYTPIDNSMLIFTWYKMPSGKYEIVSYLS